ncbi:MAG: hypothetical protein M0036_00465 [Desulfobacteraceae bacterium]|nr:hypothetical protein [Desulfobacteraceae bacterium]
MGQVNRIVPVILLLVVFIVLQPLLVALECIQTPASVAREFLKDYYYLDAGMQNWLCAKEGDPVQAVQNYLQSKTGEAAQRGLSVNNLRQMFTHMHLETEHHGKDAATVHVEGVTRTAINPVFMVVGKMFRMGREYPVDATLHLTKENGHWKVCPKALGIGLGQ